jgi:hypothetical protein
VCESVRGKIVWTFKVQYKELLWVTEGGLFFLNLFILV